MQSRQIGEIGLHQLPLLAGSLYDIAQLAERMRYAS